MGKKSRVVCSLLNPGFYAKLERGNHRNTDRHGYVVREWEQANKQLNLQRTNRGREVIGEDAGAIHEQP